MNLASSLLVTRTAASTETVARQEEHARVQLDAEKLELMREAAASIAKRVADEDGGGEYAEICDQHGRPVQMPEADRRHLVTGQLLQERGRKLLVQGSAEEALFLFLEADKHFSQVSLALMAIVDNYGLLMLDIAWCHYKIGKIERLPEAREKLRIARNALQRAHGQNMERLVEVKGEAAPERVMYVRLQLLEGVVAYHRGETVSAASYLRAGEDALNALVVTEDELGPLLEMGFSVSEARRALRVCHKDQAAAIEEVMRRRQQVEREREAARVERRQQRLGKTANGAPVDMALLDQLCELGFDARMCAEALRQTDNNYALAVDALTTTPDLLVRRTPAGPPPPIDHAALEELTRMGFDEVQGRAALLASGGMLERAVSMLLSGEPMDTAGDDAPNAGPTDHPQEEEETAAQRAEREQRERQRMVKRLAKQELIDALADKDEDLEHEYDLDLKEEVELLSTYRSLLVSRGKW